MENKEILIQKIESAIEEIRPYLHADGGDVKFIDLTDDYIVQIELMGSCSSCKMSPMTLKAGVEENIKRELPQIKGVVAINNL